MFGDSAALSKIIESHPTDDLRQTAAVSAICWLMKYLNELPEVSADNSTIVEKPSVKKSQSRNTVAAATQLDLWAK
jgi:hypothetical protein